MLKTVCVIMVYENYHVCKVCWPLVKFKIHSDLKNKTFQHLHIINWKTQKFVMQKSHLKLYYLVKMVDLACEKVLILIFAVSSGEQFKSKRPLVLLLEIKTCVFSYLKGIQLIENSQTYLCICGNSKFYSIYFFVDTTFKWNLFYLFANVLISI